jgi:hypothetical protein
MSKKYRKDTEIEIHRKTVVQDIILKLPDGKTITLQYRNYAGTEQECNYSIDLVLSQETNVYNWLGTGMVPAPTIGRNATHIHNADQICIIF